MIELLHTTNSKFKYMQGIKYPPNKFTIGLVIWFGDFHTSTLQNIEYKHTKKYTDLVATTLNSVYTFRIGEIVSAV